MLFHPKISNTAALWVGPQVYCDRNLTRLPVEASSVHDNEFQLDSE